jgi:hypothetical protein
VWGILQSDYERVGVFAYIEFVDIRVIDLSMHPAAFDLQSLIRNTDARWMKG